MRPQVDIKKIIDLRQKLHKFPQLSMYEDHTIEILKRFFQRYHPSQVLEFSNAIGFAFGGINDQPPIVFRAELDALPIEETLQMTYSSVNSGISHKCGHDGHMAILTGLAEAIVRTGGVQWPFIILFQRAEETLSGAIEVVSDKNFKQLNPKYIIGFHNIPGYEKNLLLIKDKEITAYVSGMKIELDFGSAHAAQREAAWHFVEVMEKLVSYLKNKILPFARSNDADITITHVNAGKPAFGLSPDSLRIYLTFRAFDNDVLEDLLDKVESYAKQLAKENSLKWAIEYTEDAPAVYNDSSLVDLAIDVAQSLSREVKWLSEPFRWGEDFGFYTVQYKGLYFGIGAGKDVPQLHTPEYDFPDEIIYPTIEFLFNLYLNLSQKL